MFIIHFKSIKIQNKTRSYNKLFENSLFLIVIAVLTVFQNSLHEMCYF